MTRGQIILIAVFLVGIAALYYFGPLQPAKKSVTPETVAGPAGSFSPDSFLNAQLNTLPADTLSRLRELEARVQTDTSGEAHKTLEEIIRLLQNNRKHMVSVFYQQQLAERINTDSIWVQTAHGFHQVAFATDNQSLSDYLLSQAAAAYKKALERNPDNTDAKIDLAMVFMEGPASQVMEGVMLLREVVEQDSNNITAHLILGRYGIISGQFDKAIQRLQKVLSLDSLNAEAYLYLAEAYESLGRNEEAIEMLEKCKSIVKNPDFTEEVDNYILKLKGS
ncbi:MAG: hypothetical protein KatS3mg031_2500 [Chitinophagales bacterium]|nr:MAG: hypothetical protein KatS3mg031_2500 [Chitinophagales bacterium]